MSKLQVIPKGHRVTNVGGQNFLVTKTRSRRKFKLPKKTRDRMRASARKIKFPIVQGTMIGYGVLDAGQAAMAHSSTMSGKIRRFADVLFKNYTGWDNTRNQFKISNAKGLLGVGAWTIVSKTGIFGMANRLLGRYNVPFARL